MAPVPKIVEVPSTPNSHSSLKRRINDTTEDEDLSSSKKSSKDIVNQDSVSNMSGKKASEWRSFWVPALSTTAEPDRIEKPVNINLKQS